MRSPSGVLLGALLFVLVVTLAGGAAAPVPRVAPPWIGVLQPDPHAVDAYAEAGVEWVTLELAWDAFEPHQGAFDQEYLRATTETLTRFRAAGLRVQLDLGLQYPPAWVFDLPGDTRFVNQFGDAWTGPTGQDVANGVFNPAVRAAQENYVGAVARGLGGAAIEAVRIGGLLSGELRYPPSEHVGRRGSLWGFDAAARSASPVPGWRPGSGSAADAARWADFYLGALASYEDWLLGLVHRSFPAAERHLLLPGWGLRPGQLVAAVEDGRLADGLGGDNDSLSEGLDWERQLQVLAASPGGRVVAVTTWLDAPEFGAGEAQQAPVQYLAMLTERFGLPLAAENTGGGGLAALQLSLDRARGLLLDGVMWFSGRQLASGHPPTLDDLARGTRRWR